MAWIMDTYSMKMGYSCAEIVTGKPVELGGCVGRREATGRGVTYTIVEAMKELDLPANKSTAVVQGFGNVGAVVCQELFNRGVKIIGVGDRYGSIQNPKGIDIPSLTQYVAGGRLLKDFPGGERIASSELLTMPCTILVPAALERVITDENAGRLKCKILAEAANGPTTPEADEILANRNGDMFIIPDILCNAGGVTVSYFEWVQDLQQFLWSMDQVNQKLEELILGAYRRVRKLAADRGISNRAAALTLGIHKIAKEKELRGLYP
jgi:glutamate dehydrogenase (NAD(P)+)